MTGIPQEFNGRPLVWTWHYRAASGSHLGTVARYGSNGSKECIPFFGGAAWKAGAPAEPRPLFGLAELAKSSRKWVFIAEGEKAAAALQSLGIVTVTSQGGSKAASKTDWKPLSGIPKAYLLPDNDEPGQAYVRDVAALLRSLPEPPELFVVTLPALPPAGDIVDWLQSLCAEWDGFQPIPGEHRERLYLNFRQAVKDHARPYSAPGPDVSGGDDWPEPISLESALCPAWPSDVYPEPLQSFTEALARATETPRELSAALTLAAVAAAAQGKFIVRMKPDYCEPTNIWMCPVMVSGTRKTGVVTAATAPLSDWEQARAFEMEPQIKKAQSDRKTAEAKLASMRAKAAKQDDPFEYDILKHEIARFEAAMPEVPRAPRVWADDTTPE